MFKSVMGDLFKRFPFWKLKHQRNCLRNLQTFWYTWDALHSVKPDQHHIVIESYCKEGCCALRYAKHFLPFDAYINKLSLIVWIFHSAEMLQLWILHPCCVCNKENTVILHLASHVCMNLFCVCKEVMLSTPVTLLIFSNSQCMSIHWIKIFLQSSFTAQGHIILIATSLQE